MRKHHNNKGRQSIKSGNVYRQNKRTAKKLGVPMAAKILDKVITSEPVDRIAAYVISKGYEYIPDKKNTGGDSTYPHKTVSIRHRNIKDLTGRRFGRFVVIGAAESNYNLKIEGREIRWVVKCDCGRYSFRRGKAIRNPKNNGDRCDNCRHLAYLKRHQEFIQTGKN